jgi:hypothetical protein
VSRIVVRQIQREIEAGLVMHCGQDQEWDLAEHQKMPASEVSAGAWQTSVRKGDGGAPLTATRCRTAENLADL